MRYLSLVLLVLLQMLGGVSYSEAATVDADDLSKAIKREFSEKGLGDDVDLEFFGGETNFEADNAKIMKILVTNLFTEEKINKFTAGVEIFADGVLLKQTEIIGKYFILHKVWVPETDIEKDQIIKESDLISQMVREGRLRDDVVTDKDELVGKQVVRLLKADKLVSLRDIRDEVLVKKGQMATVVYQNRGLQITSKMEALEDGSKEQIITLVNNKSGKEVVGKVVDKNMVLIVVE